MKTVIVPPGFVPSPNTCTDPIEAKKTLYKCTICPRDPIIFETGLKAHTQRVGHKKALEIKTTGHAAPQTTTSISSGNKTSRPSASKPVMPTPPRSDASSDVVIVQKKKIARPEIEDATALPVAKDPAELKRDRGRQAAEAYRGCREVAENLVKGLVAEMGPSRNWDHRGLRNLAMRIAHEETPEVDLKVVEFLALFHEVAGQSAIRAGRVSVSGLTAEASSTPSALTTILAPFLNHKLTAQVLTGDHIAMIMYLLPFVPWTVEADMRKRDVWPAHHDASLALCAVQDADRLDGMGVEGIVRFAQAMAVEDGVGTEAEIEDGETKKNSVQAVLGAMIKRSEGMKTASGKLQAKQRCETVKVMLEGRKQERRAAGPYRAAV